MVEARHPSLVPRYWAITVLAPLLFATACLSALVFDMVWLGGQPDASLGPDQAVNLCVSVRLAGGWRAATWWEPAISTRTGRARRPFVQPRLACALIPWTGWLPSTGNFQTSN